MLFLLPACLPAQTGTAAADTSWLATEGGKPIPLQDARLRSLIENALAHEQHFDPPSKPGAPAPPLLSAIDDVMSANRPAIVREGRYYTAAGCMAHSCETGGMLWVDTAASAPMVAFAELAPGKEGESTLRLTLFLSDAVSAGLPKNLLQAITGWTSDPEQLASIEKNQYRAPKISEAFLQRPSGPAQPVDPAVIGTASMSIAAAGPVTDPTWLLNYQGERDSGGYAVNAVIGDGRFLPFLNSYLPRTQHFWDKQDTMAMVAQQFLGVPGKAAVVDRRYWSATGCVPHDCGDKGLLWVDTAARPPLVLFAATTGAPDRNYALYLVSSDAAGPTIQNLQPAARASVLALVADEQKKPYGTSIREVHSIGRSGEEQIFDPRTAGLPAAAAQTQGQSK